MFNELSNYSSMVDLTIVLFAAQYLCTIAQKKMTCLCMLHCVLLLEMLFNKYTKHRPSNNQGVACLNYSKKWRENM